jgi:hypothetical protein
VATTVWVEYALVPDFTLRDSNDFWIGRQEEHAWIVAHTRGCTVNVVPSKQQSAIASDARTFIPFEIQLVFRTARDATAYREHATGTSKASRAMQAVESVLTQTGAEEPIGALPGPVYEVRRYLFRHGVFDCEVDLVAAWMGTGVLGQHMFMQKGAVIDHVKGALDRLSAEGHVKYKPGQDPVRLEFHGWPDYGDILRAALRALGLPQISREDATREASDPEEDRPSLRIVHSTP